MTDHIESSAAMQHARRKSAKVSTNPNPSPAWRPMQIALSAESHALQLISKGDRIKLTANVRAGRAKPGPSVEIDMSEKAAQRLGRALVRKVAEATGIGGVRPIVLDNVALCILQEVSDTLATALNKGPPMGSIDRGYVQQARNTLARILSEIEMGASHG